MTANLRPMNLGEILDRTFQIYRARFLVFVGIAALPSGAMLLVYAANQLWFHVHELVHPYRQPGTLLWNFIVQLGFYHISSVLILMLEPAFFKVTSGIIFEQEITLRGSLRFAFARWRRYLLIAALKQSAGLVGPELIMTGLVIGGAALGDYLGTLDDGAALPVALVLVPPLVIGIYLFLRIGSSLSLSVGASALENLKATASVRRSWKLTSGSRLRIAFAWLAFFLVFWLFRIALYGLLGGVLAMIAGLIHSRSFLRTAYLPAADVLGTAVSAIVTPIYPVALTLFYYDQRIRLEGYDIERMMDAAGMMDPGMTAPLNPAEAAEIAAPAEAGEARS